MEAGVDMPYTLLFGLQDGTKIVTKNGEMLIPSRSVLLMSGDFVHAGAAYKNGGNMRIHLYMCPPEFKINGNNNAQGFVGKFS